MSDTAFQTQYRQEFVAAFEQRASLLRATVTTEVEIKGNVAEFLVAGSGGATAVTRGVNGLIPARADALTQNACNLSEWHDLVRKTKFNVFASQGNQRAIMQQTTMAVLNRKTDSDIIAALNTGTVNTGAAQTASMQLIAKAKTKLGNAGVPWDGNITFLITPAFGSYLLQMPEFNKATIVGQKMPMDMSDTSWRDKPIVYMWQGACWIEHPNLPGVGTNAEVCFAYHKSAIGHAIDTANIESPVGYNEEQAYSWARCSGMFGSKVLQNSGIVIINHDGSQLS
ncbi:MAG TPA: phage capsid protein [Steroidobacteraceae bacterium]|nr:phage capsid protein [Steroidobacteraceae bacterium]